MDLGPNDGKLLWRGPPRYEQTQTACRYQIRKDFMLKNFANIPLEGTAQRYVLNDSDIRGHHRKWDEECYLRSQ